MVAVQGNESLHSIRDLYLEDAASFFVSNEEQQRRHGRDATAALGLTCGMCMRGDIGVALDPPQGHLSTTLAWQSGRKRGSSALMRLWPQLAQS
jgi:hypothetical protein